MEGLESSAKEQFLVNLLWKYMGVVGYNEGVSFVRDCQAPDFTQEELNMLAVIENKEPFTPGA